MDFCPAAAEQSNKKERELNAQKAKGGGEKREVRDRKREGGRGSEENMLLQGQEIAHWQCCCRCY